MTKAQEGRSLPSSTSRCVSKCIHPMDFCAEIQQIPLPAFEQQLRWESIWKAPERKESYGHLVLGYTGNEMESSVFSISHSISINSKHCFSLRKARRVIDFTYSGFTSAFSQIQSRREKETKQVRAYSLLSVNHYHND